MRIPLYQIDAFTNTVFRGNPAAVCPLEHWLDDATMQAIAAENNLPETAFFVREGADEQQGYGLRWFTPTLEIPLCGHATLASGYVLYNFLGYTADTIRFFSKSGELRVHRTTSSAGSGNTGAGRLALDFPARPLQACAAPAGLTEALGYANGSAPQAVYRSLNNYLVVAETEQEVRAMKPDVLKLTTLDAHGVIVTARASRDSTDSRYDCVSRYFAPNAGVDEDPVTGSAHCSIVPYWAGVLGKSTIVAYQASARGGELWCKLTTAPSGEHRVEMAGDAVLYLQGWIELP